MVTNFEAELIGLHVGDGSLYKTNRSIVWELRGDLKEKEFYDGHVKHLLESIFNMEFLPKFRSGGKNGCYGIQTSKKVVTQFFIDHHFAPGRKTYSVAIPQEIKDAMVPTQCAFVRGLFDTDGCLRFDRINRNTLHTYPKIEFGFASVALRDDLALLLKTLNFKPYMWDSVEFKLCLVGRENLEIFMKKFSPKTTKHLKRFWFWRDHGYLLPRSHNLVLRR